MLKALSICRSPMMSDMRTITMSMRELDRFKIVQAVIDGCLQSGQAARRLQLTPRQIQRLVNRYQAQGAAGLVNRDR
jgi:transcriptional regulator with GAF, ATPase, and Fis domain